MSLIRILFGTLFVILMSLANSIVFAQGEGIFFHSLSTESGLSQTTIQCMYQDSKGFMWFGTQDGLNRYDGYTMKVFRHDDSDDNSISNNYINSIIEDKDGIIWIGTDNGLNYYNYETGLFGHYLKTGDSTGVTHQKVSALCVDNQNRLWVGTEQGVDLFDYDTKTFLNNDFDHLLFNNRIIALSADSKGNIWIGALNVGLVFYNPSNETHTIFQKGTINHISNNNITAILEDSNGAIWVGTKDGLNFYESDLRTFKKFGKEVYQNNQLSSSQIRSLAEDFNKNIIIGTYEGLNIFNPQSQTLQSYNQKSNTKGNLNHFYIYSLLVDKSGTVWIGTFFGGINYYNNTTQHFKYYNPSSGKEYVFGTIGPMVEVDGNIWIGTGGGGLLKFNIDKQEFNHYPININDNSFSTNQVRSMSLYKDYLLIGTGTSELLLYDYNKQAIHKKFDVKAYTQGMYSDKNGDVWICTNEVDGLKVFNGDKVQAVYHYDENQKKHVTFPYVRTIIEDSPDLYWIGTRYLGLFKFNRITGKAENFVMDKNKPNSLKSNNISTLFVDSKNNIWIGTEGAGIAKYNRKTSEFNFYCEDDGLINRNVLGILEDTSGNLWISTLSGLSKFNPEEEKFTNYSYGNGFPLNEMSNKSYLRLADDQFVFGGINGIVLFHPEKIKKNEYKPPVIISEFRLFNKDANKSENIRKQYFTKTENIRLKYNQSSFFVNYTALNYSFSNNNQYAYILEGFDDDWNYVGDQRIAIYTNLSAGEYTFRVKGSNNDGVWNDEGAYIKLKILPPPWLTWWAYLIYFLILSGVFLSFLKYMDLENKIKFKQVEQQNMEHVHQMRIRLFTNFSHELRTPLSLIVGPVEDLLSRIDLGQTIREPLVLIQRNTQRLLMLVNQLMDFRKQESGKMQLKAAKGNFIKFSHELVIAFNELAKKRKIDYTFKPGEEEIIAWFDRILFEKVYFNLLSNAFKNTPENGSIEVSVFKSNKEKIKSYTHLNVESLMAISSDDFLEIIVKDNGKGIDEKELKNIFDPFYQVQSDEYAQVGSGIGLSLTKGIVEMHYGLICAESNLGQGALFRVIFPVGPDHLKPEEITSDYKSSEDLTHYAFADTENEIEQQTSVDKTRKKHSILVIEDNQDVRNYIKKHLWGIYTVYEATNGEEGLERAIKYMPDLIVSDIMMPKIDGLQLCKKLKNDIHTSHIPIILLTARVTYQQVKEGFEIGADDYVTKPFSAGNLLVRINALIENRERLRKLFQKKSPLELSNPYLPSMDDRFLKKLYEIVDANISESDFNIEQFSEEIGMSRANLYRKIKTLTNLSPNEFIKDIRLRIAVKYLKETSFTISEISYKTGFNSPAYFTNCFKKAFGVSPSEFLGSEKESNVK